MANFQVERWIEIMDFGIVENARPVPTKERQKNGLIRGFEKEREAMGYSWNTNCIRAGYYILEAYGA